jgi:LPXTG-motif cell wall-anchored protein
LGLDIRRNVAPISWAVIAGGLFLSLMGVLGLRSRRQAA